MLLNYELDRHLAPTNLCAKFHQHDYLTLGSLSSPHTHRLTSEHFFGIPMWILLAHQIITF